VVAYGQKIESIERAGISTPLGSSRGGALTPRPHTVPAGAANTSAARVNTCVGFDEIAGTRATSLGFHAGWVDDKTGKPVTSSEGTELLYQLYPPAIRSWIANHGGLSARTILLKGRELAAFYSSCQ
jgi:hypothetical protein